MRPITQKEAARLLDISQQAVQKKVNGTPRPSWVYRDSARHSWRIDGDHPDFLALIKKVEDAEEAELSSAELDAASRRAQLEIHIQKVDLNKYKIEQERLKLEQAAGKLVEWSVCEYLFLGYLERINRELLSYPARLEKKIELAIQEGVHATLPPSQIAGEVRKMIVRENEAVIKETKAAQKKDIEGWEEK